jgi:hypothetical protein
MYLCVSGIDFASFCYFIFNIIIYFIQGSLTCPGVALASENEKKSPPMHPLYTFVLTF